MVAQRRGVAEPDLGRDPLHRPVGLLQQLLGSRVSPQALRLITLLVERGRVDSLPKVRDDFHRLLNAHRGVVEATVTSAVPLPPEIRQELNGVLDRLTGKSVELVETVDPEILGGLVVRVGDRKFDDSVSRELELLTAAFAVRGSRELLRIQEYIHNSEATSRGV